MGKKRKSNFRKSRHGSIHHIVPRSRGGPSEDWNETLCREGKHVAWHQLFENLLPSECIELIEYWTTKKGELDRRKIRKSKIEIWKKVFGERTPAQAIKFIEENFIPAEKRFLKEQMTEKLFEKQLQRLLDLGYAKAAGMDNGAFSNLICQLKNELNKVPEDISEGNIPFLIVIPAGIVSVRKQISMIKVDKNTGYIYHHFDLALLRNAPGVETPTVPYLIYNVETGAKMRNISPANCINQFTKEKRRGLTLIEGIALVTHYPEILKDHYINFPGSCYGSLNIPGLWLYYGRPELRFYWVRDTKSNWGSASCDGGENYF